MTAIVLGSVIWLAPAFAAGPPFGFVVERAVVAVISNAFLTTVLLAKRKGLRVLRPNRGRPIPRSGAYR